MKAVIDRDKLERHTINRYNFKVFAIGASSSGSVADSVLVEGTPETSVDTETPVTPVSQEKELVSTSEEVSDSPMTTDRDALVESLLKKADDMSSNVIKMQMKIEEMEIAHQKALEDARQIAYDEGVEAGRDQSTAEHEAAQQSGAEQFALSVKTLEERSGEFAVALEAVKEELLHAAVDIAQEVILLEVKEHASAIAKQMASQLITELQEASKIVLRVNPADHGPLSEAIGSLERVEVISDSAVSPGGVIAISDAGNIDAEVMKRFERVKSAALSG